MNTWFSWSSGKDSAYALSVLLKDESYKVSAIFTSLNENFSRVAMHSVREELLERQAEELGLPLHKIMLPYPCSNEIYEERMRDFISLAKSEGVEAMAFGDLYLEDVRDYRVKQLEGSGITPIFPIWELPTSELSKRLVQEQFKAIITCVDPSKLGEQFSGQEYSKEFLSSLPTEVDPCGENGEFHSFIYDCPIFSSPIPVKVGESVTREGFAFTDVKLA